MYQALLLNHNYQALQFIPERRAICLYFNNKVEVISEWDSSFNYLNKNIKYPAIIRLKYLVKRPIKQLKFNRYNVFKRDNFICQYCNLKLYGKNITVDHVLPRASGGKNNFLNCVTSCYPCNNKKGNRTPEQAGFVLLSKPYIPMSHHVYGSSEHSESWHDSWKFYLCKS